MKRKSNDIPNYEQDFDNTNILNIKPPIFSNDIIRYSDCIRKIILESISKKEYIKLETLNQIKLNYMKTKFINGMNKCDRKFSIRDGYNSSIRKIIFITEMLVEYAISLQDNFTPDPRIFKTKYSFYQDISPNEYTMYQLRNAISFLRRNLMNTFYTKEIEQFYTCLKRRVVFFIFNKHDEVKEPENNRLYNLTLLCSRNIENNEIELTQFFFDLYESWVYNMDRKFFIAKECYYTSLGNEIKESYVTKLIRIFKENVSKSVVTDTVENSLCPNLPDRLILTGEKEHHAKYGSESESTSSFSILNIYRRCSIAPYIKMINYRSGLVAEFVKKSGYYYGNTEVYGNRDIVIEEISIEISNYIFREKTGFSIYPYVFREEDIMLPLSNNPFFKDCYPSIISTHRGWNLWDCEEKKFLNYITFIEAFIAFLYTLDILKYDIKYKYCSERNDLLKCKGVFGKIFDTVI